MTILDQDQQELFEVSQPHYLFVDDDIPILTLFKIFFHTKQKSLWQSTVKMPWTR